MAGKQAGWMRIIGDFQPIDSHVDGTDISSAVVLTPAAGSSKLLIQATAQDVRYTLDGTTPAAAKGFQLKSDDPPLMIVVAKGMTITVIEETATADIQYQWGM